MSETIFKSRKSYLLLEKLSPENFEKLKSLGATEGFVPVFLADHEAVADAYSKISHCMGLIVQGPLQKEEIARVQDFEKLSHVKVKILNPGEDVIESAQSLIKDLFPSKLRELCLFSVSKIFPMLIPGSSTEWTEPSGSRTDPKADFMVSCETLADHFMGNVMIRGGFQSLRSSSSFFSPMSDDEILNFCAEVGNEVLGVVNFNLLKARIAAQVALPMMIKENEGTGFRRRSSYYLPSFALRDVRSGIQVTFQFLVPFLKDSNFDRELNFEVGWGQEETVELF